MPLPPLVEPAAELTRQEVMRYSRHLIIPDVAMDGQKRLKNAKVLAVGAGGLGQPDPDVPRRRRRRHARHRRLRRRRREQPAAPGHPRPERHRPAQGARARGTSVQEINPLIDVVLHEERLDSTNVMEIFSQYDLIVDGTDNFATRYMVNDAAFLLGKPYVWGSIYRFDGQASVFWPTAPGGDAPCYRCLYPEPPPPGMVPSCAEGGVLGVLCASIGSIQTTEADQAAHRHRRAAGRLADGLRRPRDGVPQDPRPQGPGVPALRQEPDHHRAHRLRGLLRRRVGRGPGGRRRQHHPRHRAQGQDGRGRRLPARRRPRAGRVRDRVDPGRPRSSRRATSSTARRWRRCRRTRRSSCTARAGSARPRRSPRSRPPASGTACTSRAACSPGPRRSTRACRPTRRDRHDGRPAAGPAVGVSGRRATRVPDVLAERARRGRSTASARAARDVVALVLRARPPTSPAGRATTRRRATARARRSAPRRSGRRADVDEPRAGQQAATPSSEANGTARPVVRASRMRGRQVGREQRVERLPTLVLRAEGRDAERARRAPAPAPTARPPRRGRAGRTARGSRTRRRRTPPAASSADASPDPDLDLRQVARVGGRELDHPGREVEPERGAASVRSPGRAGAARRRGRTPGRGPARRAHGQLLDEARRRSGRTRARRPRRRCRRHGRRRRRCRPGRSTGPPARGRRRRPRGRQAADDGWPLRMPPSPTNGSPTTISPSPTDSSRICCSCALPRTLSTRIPRLSSLSTSTWRSTTIASMSPVMWLSVTDVAADEVRRGRRHQRGQADLLDVGRERR